MTELTFEDKWTNPSYGANVVHSSSDLLTWAALRAAAGNYKSSGTVQSIYFVGGNTSNKWLGLYREVLIYSQTGDIPDGATITAAKIRLKGYSKSDPLGNVPSVNIYGCNLSSGGPHEEDYNNIGSVKFCDTPIAYADWKLNDWNEFVLNAAGIAAISKTGLTAFGVREVAHDAEGATPIWGSYQGATIGFYGPVLGQAGNQPQLVVTYSLSVVRTDPVTDVTKTSATLNGTLLDDGNDAPVACSFQWGLTPAYGNATAPGVVAKGHSFSAGIAALTKGKAYHFRAKAVTNTGDIAYGADLTFITGAGSAPFYVILEAAFDQSIFSDPETADWTDCTDYLRGLHIKRGRMHELDRVEAGTAEVLVDNDLGDWWRKNTGGAFYQAAQPTPHEVVKPLTLVRISNSYENTVYRLFYGTMESLPHRWLDAGGFGPYLEMTAVDIFKAFSRCTLRVRGILSDAAAAQKSVIVEGAATFYPGQEVKVGDSVHSEYNEVASTSGDTLVMTNSLAHTYSVSNGGYVNKFVAQLSGDRLWAVLDDLGWLDSMRDFTLGAGQVMVIEHTPPTGGTNAMEHVQGVVEAENGLLFQAGDGTIVYQDSLARQKPPYDEVTATFRDSDVDSKYVEPELVDDDTFIYNGASISGTGFSEVTIQDSEAAGIQGERTLPKKDSLIFSQADAFDQALQIVLRFGGSFIRCNWLNVKPDASPADLYPRAFGYDLSTRIKLQLNSARNPAMLDQEYHIEGVEHSWSAGGAWATKWQLWKVSQYKVFSTIPHTGFLSKENPVYLTAQGAGSADDVKNDAENPIIVVGQANYGTGMSDDFWVFRGCLEIDTKLLNPAVGILSAYVGFHVNSYNVVSTPFYVRLVPATGCHQPLVLTDYGELLDNVLDLGSALISPPSMTDDQWVVIPLTADGIAAIVRDGVNNTKFALRSSRDISGLTPGTPGVLDESIAFDGFGAALKPRLFVEVA